MQSVRNDPLGQMYARRQIDHVRYMAGRGYQELFECSQLGHYGSGDPSRMTSHSAGSSQTSDAIDRQSIAAARLRKIDRSLRADLGMHGLVLTRAVLIARKPATGGARTKREKLAVAFIFQTCLTLIAIQLGLATHSIKREDRAIERKLRKDGRHA